MEVRVGKTVSVFIHMLSMDTANATLCCPNQAKIFSKLYWKLGCNRRELHFIDAQAQILDMTDLILTRVQPLTLWSFLDASQSSSEPASTKRKSAILSRKEGEREKKRGNMNSSASSLRCSRPQTPAPGLLLSLHVASQIPHLLRWLAFGVLDTFIKKTALPILGSYPWPCPRIPFRIFCHITNIYYQRVHQ